MWHLDVHSHIPGAEEERTLKQRRQDVIGNDDVNREEGVSLTLLLNRRLDLRDELRSLSLLCPPNGIPASSLACDGLDDLAVALIGKVPSTVWVTRLEAELPRAALLSFGLPMNMERADERIKADVIVGNDGLARAIRFVR